MTGLPRRAWRTSGWTTCPASVHAGGSSSAIYLTVNVHYYKPVRGIKYKGPESNALQKKAMRHRRTLCANFPNGCGRTDIMPSVQRQPNLCRAQ